MSAKPSNSRDSGNKMDVEAGEPLAPAPVARPPARSRSPVVLCAVAVLLVAAGLLAARQSAASARDVGRRRLGPRYTGYKNHAYDMDNSGTVPQGHQWVNYRMKGIMNLPLRNGVTPYRVNDVPPYFKSEDDPVTPPDIV